MSASERDFMHQQRGTLTLFANLLPEQAPAQPGKHKGRSAELIDKRNECLINRYVYYLKYSELRYSSILQRLSTEFFLSTVTIPDILADNADKVKELNKETPPKNSLSKLWPHLQW